MELIDTILTVMMASAINTIIAAIMAIISSSIHLLINVSVVNYFSQIKLLDQYLAIHGICLIKNYDHVETPEPGYHFLISRKWIFPTGFLIAHKQVGSGGYKIYWLGSSMRELRISIIGDPNLVYERTITLLDPKNPQVQIRRTLAPDVANSWQTKIVDLIMNDYNKRQHSTWIVCGPPGCGKTTLGLLVAKRLTGPGTEPVLVTGVDFETPGLSLGIAYYTPIVTSPVILMLNEFDNAIRHAERKDDKTSACATTCIANTPATILNTLDYIASTRYLILIATTNMKQSDLVTGIYKRYTRAGRFDNHYQVNSCGTSSARRAPPCRKKYKTGKS